MNHKKAELIFFFLNLEYFTCILDTITIVFIDWALTWINLILTLVSSRLLDLILKLDVPLLPPGAADAGSFLFTLEFIYIYSLHTHFTSWFFLFFFHKGALV